MSGLAARAGRYARAGARWSRLLTAGRPDPGVRVFYGHDRVPAPGEPVAGGTAKFQRLATRFPNHPTDFSLLYLGSTWLPRDLRALLWHVRRRRLPLLLNQDGVGYPGWAGSGTEAFNRPLAYCARRRRARPLPERVLQARGRRARSAEPVGTWEVLHNAVDVRHFTPAEQPPEGGPVLLLGGDQYQAYRLELGLETLAALLPSHPDAQLLVTGRLVTPPGPTVERLGLRRHVHVPRALLAGRGARRSSGARTSCCTRRSTTRARASCSRRWRPASPSSTRGAAACRSSSATTRASACPIRTASSGTSRRAPDELARRASRGCSPSYPPTAAAARARAVERFALEPWLDRHAELFARFAPR